MEFGLNCVKIGRKWMGKKLILQKTWRETHNHI
jgi:hypothetical protein